MKYIRTPYDQEIAECATLGTDAEYQAFVKSFPPAIPVSRNMPVEYCHVRRAYNSGTATKPPFSGVPLTREQHALQHSKGEAACLNEYLHNGIYHTRETAKEWFDAMAASYRKLWIEFKTGGK